MGLHSHAQDNSLHPELSLMSRLNVRRLNAAAAASAAVRQTSMGHAWYTQVELDAAVCLCNKLTIRMTHSNNAWIVPQASLATTSRTAQMSCGSCTATMEATGQTSYILGKHANADKHPIEQAHELALRLQTIVGMHFCFGDHIEMY